MIATFDVGRKRMDQKIVKKLEQELEQAVAEVILKLGLKRLPLLPDRQTMHLMSKAAVTVYEAAVMNHRTDD